MGTDTIAAFWAARRKAVAAAAGGIATIGMEYVCTSTEVATWLADYVPANLVPVIPVVLGTVGIVLGVHRIPNATIATAFEDAVEAAKTAYQDALPAEADPAPVAVAAIVSAPSPLEPVVPAVEVAPATAAPVAVAPVPSTTTGPFWAGVTTTDTPQAATSFVELVPEPNLADYQ